MIYEALDVLVN